MRALPAFEIKRGDSSVPVWRSFPPIVINQCGKSRRAGQAVRMRGGSSNRWPAIMALQPGRGESYHVEGFLGRMVPALLSYVNHEPVWSDGLGQPGCALNGDVATGDSAVKACLHKLHTNEPTRETNLQKPAFEDANQSQWGGWMIRPGVPVPASDQGRCRLGCGPLNSRLQRGKVKLPRGIAR